MNFREAMAYLQNLTKFGFNFGLGRIEELLRRVGEPHRELKVVHVGGTNGKGSTVAMVASVLNAAGYRVGTFTSPHLHSYTERYCINGEEIDPDRVAALISYLRPHLDAMVAEGYEHPTEFEVSTAMAFLYFKEEKVDLLVLEVGLGGIIDSTNVVVPLVSVITNVAMDHMDYLGHTIEEIALAKAGIIKVGVPVVTAADDPLALNVIERVSREKGAELVLVGRDVTWEPIDRPLSLRGQYLTVRGRKGEYSELWLPLIGRHQLTNAATAVAVLEILTDLGYRITPEVLREGLARTRWPARLEVMSENPLVVIDGAHNYDGARMLRRALDDYFPDREVVLVLGMLGDKERARVASELAPRARVAVITRPNSSRAGDWEFLAREVGRLVGHVETIADVRKAVKRALELARPEDLVCITGSLYMVADAREVLLKVLSRD